MVVNTEYITKSISCFNSTIQSATNRKSYKFKLPQIKTHAQQGFVSGGQKCKIWVVVLRLNFSNKFGLCASFSRLNAKPQNVKPRNFIPPVAFRALCFQQEWSSLSASSPISIIFNLFRRIILWIGCTLAWFKYGSRSVLRISTASNGNFIRCLSKHQVEVLQLETI